MASAKVIQIIDNVDKLTEQDHLDVYNHMRCKYIREDVESQLENRNIETSVEIIDKIVNAYVYEGDYSPSRPHWDNIDALIDKFIV